MREVGFRQGPIIYIRSIAFTCTTSRTYRRIVEAPPVTGGPIRSSRLSTSSFSFFRSTSFFCSALISAMACSLCVWVSVGFCWCWNDESMRALAMHAGVCEAGEIIGASHIAKSRRPKQSKRTQQRPHHNDAVAAAADCQARVSKGKARQGRRHSKEAQRSSSPHSRRLR